MRVTNAANVRMLMEAIRNLRANEQDLIRNVASGKRVSRPSDNPIDESQIAVLKKDIDRLGRFSEAVRTVELDYRHYDSTLNEVNNLLQSAFQKGEAAATTTYGTGELQILATELKDIRQRVLALGNTSADGRYIFAGTAITTEPFTLDSGTGVVTYLGDPEIITVEVDEGMELPKNLAGDRVFMSGAGIFDPVSDLIQAVETNDLTGMHTALGELGQSMRELAVVRGENGGHLETVETVKSLLQNRATNVRTILSDVEDADMAEVITSLNLNETALQAVFSTAAASGRNSLFNYLA